MSSPPPPPPPACLCPDDYSAADSARRRRLKKSGVTRFFSLPNLRSSASPGQTSPSPFPNAGTDDSDPLIFLDKSALADEMYADRFEWAVLYENQRGMTMFSIPYYSRLSLLPTDPSPFTVPNASFKRSEQPQISLTDYPMPDGTWRWVSKAWMIDMRSDSGEVQHDGFEYNWMFRKHNWRAEVGALSAGGWVRRRRWIRLMMRPAMHRRLNPDDNNTKTAPNTPVIGGDLSGRHCQVTPLHGNLDLKPDEVWRGDDVEANWTRCRMIMMQYGRDGRKLELWQAWLGDSQTQSQGRQRRQQWTEDDIPMPSEVAAVSRLRIGMSSFPPKESIAPVLREYGETIMRSFIYPESRAELVKMVEDAGLSAELKCREVDFWSLHVASAVDGRASR